MNFLFVDTHFGQMVILVGCIISFVQSYKKFDLSYMFSYLMMTLALWFLFIKPVVSLGDTTSAMEKEGWSRTTTNDYLENQYVEGEKLSEGSSLGLVYISRGFNALAQGTIKAITKATGKEEMSYLKNPFIVNKVAAYLKDFTANGITKDAVLKKNLQWFLIYCYQPTLQLVTQDAGPEDVTVKWWPGQKDIVARYCVECKEDCQKRWIGINEDLNQYIEKYTEKSGFSLGGLFFKTRRYSYNNPLGETDVLKVKLLQPEVKKAAQNVFNNLGSLDDTNEKKSASLINEVSKWLAFGAAGVGQFFSNTAAQALIKMLPHIQAWGCLIAYSLFPFTLLICFLWRKASPLVEYFTTIFWLKAWVITWAIIHYAAIYMAEMQGKLAGGATSDWFMEKPFFNTVTSVFLIMSPAISWFFVKGVLSGVGEIATASTLHADKAIGKVKI